MRGNVRLKLAAYSALFIAFGATVVMIGPMLGSLATSVGRAPEQLGFLFVYASGAELVGALVAGEAFDRSANAHFVLALASLGLAIPFAAIPTSKSVLALTLCWTVSAAFRPFLTTGTNLLIAWSLGDRSAPWLNAVNGMFGLGATLAPACASAFASLPKVAHLSSLSMPFYSVSATIVIFSILILLLPPPDRRSPQQQHQHQTGTSSNDTSPGEPNLSTDLEQQEQPERSSDVEWGMLEFSVAVLFLAASTAYEVALGNWLYTIAINAGLSAPSASLVTSAYWAAFTFTRLLLVPALFALTNTTLSTCLVGSSALMCASCGCVFTLPAPSLAIWLCALVGGVSVAPCYGSTVALIREKMPFHGRTQSALAIACGVGGGIGPWLAARAMRALGWGGALAFCFATAGCCLASAGSMAFASPSRKRVASSAPTTAASNLFKNDRKGTSRKVSKQPHRRTVREQCLGFRSESALSLKPKLTLHNESFFSQSSIGPGKRRAKLKGLAAGRPSAICCFA
jgi:fucose permease